ncbi:MAG: hypothetical protein P0Y53_17615 [Candidatus Pseudobacter hemicellulosilyticus]|uniref:Uncharacterized protein n=1 Tax=Candidatus Pseudobacter hemicellulosilyticus TaxID=3121375 RepID=A0AAJ5WRB1_9BACT|nr:MAG: hypothetical protein P0Y53_17615 [Pseudobacter sp.]
MKHLSLYTWIALTGLLLAMGCTKMDHDLGDPLPADQIKFEVVQDFTADASGNTVILISNTPEIVPMWDYVIGKSIRQRDTVRFAFAGEYQIKFSAATGGGIVDKEPVTITVTKDNLNYVNDPLWTLLAGGPGNEKTWVLDGNEKGDKKFFTSPIYFSGAESTFGARTTDGQQVEWKQACAIPNGGSDICWFYAPNYTSDTWAAEQRDYGSMTFSLKGGPFLTTDHKGVGGYTTESGTYFLDENTLMLTTTNATPLFVSYSPTDAATLYSFRIVSLTENTLQLAGRHKTKNEFFVLNYLSKTFSDNWTPAPPQDPGPDSGFEPVFAAGELKDMLTGGAGKGRFWTLDATGNPVDWIGKGKGWTTGPGSSSDWGWNTGWETAVSNAWIRFDNIGGNNYTRFQNGATTTGTFTVDESDNEVILSGNTLLQNADSWMNPTATTLKVVKGWPADYKNKGVWFGTSYDGAKDEWLAFHYIIP